MECEVCGARKSQRFYELRMYCKYGDGTNSPPLMLCYECAGHVAHYPEALREALRAEFGERN